MDITHFLHKVVLPGANDFRTDYLADNCVNGCILKTYTACYNAVSGTLSHIRISKLKDNIQ